LDSAQEFPIQVAGVTQHCETLLGEKVVEKQGYHGIFGEA